MKTATARRTDIKTTPNIPYPNAATTKEMLHKFLDLATMAVVGAALAAAALFLIAVC